MNHQALQERIVSDPAVMLGKPIIRGTRVPVSLIVGFLKNGQSPDLTIEDVEAARSGAAPA